MESFYEKHKDKVRKRNTMKITIEGDTKTIPEWAEFLGVSMFLIYKRIERGWTPEEAVCTPPQQRPAR